MALKVFSVLQNLLPNLHTRKLATEKSVKKTYVVLCHSRAVKATAQDYQQVRATDAFLRGKTSNLVKKQRKKKEKSKSYSLRFDSCDCLSSN